MSRHPGRIPPACAAWSFREAMAVAACGRGGESSPLSPELVGEGTPLFFASGRAALSFALGCQAGPVEVAIPAYTCYSVAAAAVRAGCRIRLFDVDPATLEPDPGQVRRAIRLGTRMVVGTSLLGFAPDLAGLERVCGEEGALLVDDAAQGLGARSAGRPAGSFGSAGIFSFGRGKPAAGWGGGLLMLRAPLAGVEADTRHSGLPASGWGHSLAVAVQLLLSPVLQRPVPFRLLASLPFLGIGETHFDPEFPLARSGTFLTGIMRAALRGLPGRLPLRKGLADRWRDTLAGVGLVPLGVDRWGEGGHLRLGIRMSCGREREAAIRVLRQAGIQAGGLYPRSLDALEELAPHLQERRACPGAGELAETLLVLPVHPGVSDVTIRRAAQALADLSAGRTVPAGCGRTVQAGESGEGGRGC